MLLRKSDTAIVQSDIVQDTSNSWQSYENTLKRLKELVQSISIQKRKQQDYNY